MSRFLYASEQLHCVPAIVGAMLPNFRQGVVVAPIRPIKGGSDLICPRIGRKPSQVKLVTRCRFLCLHERRMNQLQNYERQQPRVICRSSTPFKVHFKEEE